MTCNGLAEMESQRQSLVMLLNDKKILPYSAEVANTAANQCKDNQTHAIKLHARMMCLCLVGYLTRFRHLFIVAGDIF